MWTILVSIVVGAVCGWLASRIMKSNGSLLGYIILGILGGVVGNFVFGLLGLGASNMVGRLIVGVIGTCIVIAIYRAITGKKN